MSPETSNDKPRAERRQAQRRRVLKGGIVAFNDHYSSLPCTVRDISQQAESQGGRLVDYILAIVRNGAFLQRRGETEGPTP